MALSAIPYCDYRKVSSRYTGQELALSKCEHLQDLGTIRNF